jgi:hypothetical protein
MRYQGEKSGIKPGNPVTGKPVSNGAMIRFRNNLL